MVGAGMPCVSWGGSTSSSSWRSVNTEKLFPGQVGNIRADEFSSRSLEWMVVVVMVVVVVVVVVFGVPGVWATAVPSTCY
ncbi:hypothetical protein E2C01_087713 [Portunus trituberculatus]|uniref:Uncharacterized protein n=1 Tax=Portunus trituberculatus TaxID=210409 RepID=A0A5B7JK45_PORTR|nr:hypothetical protein [Portunus trituberculatus]